MPDQDRWAGELVLALTAEIQAGRRSRTQGVIGPARVESRSPTGVAELKVSHRGRPADRYDQTTLELQDTTSGALYRVEQVLAWSPTEIILTATVPEESGPLQLQAADDPIFILERAIELLNETPAPSAMARLILERRQPTSTPAPWEPAPGSTLNDDQIHAVRLTIADGLNVIWGPPGTGKTQTIAQAIATLVDQGRSVLLVSSTNLAVDEGLLRAHMAAGEPPPGRMVRVGSASMKAVAEHPTLSLTKACEELATQQREQLTTLEAEATELESETTPLRVCRARLGGATRERLTQARNRVENTTQRSRLEAERTVLQDQAAAAQEAIANASETHNDRQRTAGQAEAARKAHAAIGLLSNKRDQLDREIAEAATVEAHATSTVSERSAALSAARASGLFGRKRKVRDATALLADSQSELTKATDALQKLEALRLQIDRDYRNRAADSAELRSVWTPEAIDEAKAAESQARDALQRNRATRRHIAKELGRVGRSLQDLGPEPSPEDVELVERDERAPLEPLFIEHDRLQRRHAGAIQRLAELQGEAARVRSEIVSMRSRVIEEAAVVGTTLSQLVIQRSLSERTFDHVIVDEVSATLLPMLVIAANRAAGRMTLLGDFWQNSPISRTKAERLPEEVRSWLHNDVFERLDLDSPRRMRTAAGCAVLRTQYRFGPATTELANRIVYDGLLQCGRVGSWEPADGLGEIVVVDPGHLSDDDGEWLQASEPYRDSGRWWPAGVVTSMSLAQRHAINGERVGVVTPYRAQAQLLEAAVSESEFADLIEVATAARVQGQQFPVVIVDLVEDGNGKSWFAQARRDGGSWERDGLRGLNVALTRNAGRVYVIAALRAVTTATDGALRDLATMLREGRATAVDSAEQLRQITVPYRAVPEGGDLGIDVQPTPDLCDSYEFFADLAARLPNVETEVLVWSPYVAERRLAWWHRHFASLISRGIEVTAFVAPSNRVPGRNARNERTLLNRMHSIGVRVVQIDGSHEKFVILDSSVTYIGSLNALSSNETRTSEIVSRTSGVNWAGELSKKMGLARFARNPACHTHRCPCYATRSSTNGRWTWQCSVGLHHVADV